MSVKRLTFALAAIVVACSTAVSKDQTKGLLLAVNSDDDSVAFVDLSRYEVIQKITTRAHPQDVVISRDRSLAYVAEMGTEDAPGDTIAIIDHNGTYRRRSLALTRSRSVQSGPDNTSGSCLRLL